VIKHFEAQFWTEVQKLHAHMRAIDSDANADRTYLMGFEDGIGARREIDSVVDKYKNAIHTSLQAIGEESARRRRNRNPRAEVERDPETRPN
jgi:hypothetical protein